MGEDSASLCREASLGRPQSRQQWKEAVDAFIQRLGEVWAIRCVILHGSRATGNWVSGSDVDLVIIAELLPGRFRDRLATVSDLLPREVPVEALCYTPAEFEEMLDSMNVTALESVSRGIPLHGHEYFRGLKARFDNMVGRGLRRGRSVWYWDDTTPSSTPERT
ncbi:MAG: nucleotidyltransferase domain-containing protein [Bacillota bacterium]